MAYLNIRNVKNIFLSYLTFLGALKGPGVTPGMKIEIIIVLLCISFYVMIKTGSWYKACLSLWLSYTIGFIYGASEYFLQNINRIFNLDPIANAPLLGLFTWLIVFFILLNIYLYLYDKIYFISFWKNIRVTRVLHYYGMFFLGIALSNGTLTINSLLDLLNLPVALINIFFAGVFSLITNDLADLNIDRITNPARPLITGDIKMSHYKYIAYWCLFFAIIYGFFSRTGDCIPLIFIILFLITYFIYSVPPLRFKRIPLFSKLAISANSFYLILFGYYLSRKNLINFPLPIVLYLFTIFALAINLIDIKDYLGDKNNKILTLPVLVGIKNAKIIISIFVLLAFIIFPIITRQFFLLPVAIILGLIDVFFINRKKYNENLVFSIYLIGLYSSIILFFLKNSAN